MVSYSTTTLLAIKALRVLGLSRVNEFIVSRPALIARLVFVRLCSVGVGVC